MVVLFPIETASRELLYKVYLCHLLAARGFRCYLGNKVSLKYLMQRFSNYIYLDKGYHKGTSEKLYENVKRHGGVIFNLDEEGAVDFHDNSSLFSRYSESMIENVAHVFLWGRSQHALLQDRFKDQNRVTISGHPRFELLKSQYRHLFADEIKKLQNQHGKFILINTNMGFGNNIKGDVSVEKNYGARFANIREIIAFDKVKLAHIVDLCKQIAARTNSKVILRPHPEENKATYQKEFAGQDAIQVIYEGTVVPWLMACDVMIHPDCTTAVESLMMGKKSISYLPQGYDSNLVTRLPLLASDNCHTVDEVLALLGQFGTAPVGEHFEFLEQYFNFSANSLELVVNAFDREARGRALVSRDEISLSSYVYLQYRSFKNRISYTKASQLRRNKLSGFNTREIRRLHRLISSTTAERSLVQRITPSLFRFIGCEGA